MIKFAPNAIEIGDRAHLRDVVPYVLNYRGSWNYPVSYSFDRRRTDIELQHTIHVSENLRGVWGGQLRNEGVHSESYFSSPDWLTSSLYRLFGNLEWHPYDRWIVAAGVMAEKNTITGSSLSPSLALNYEFLPGHTLRVRFANARRTPTLYESEADWGYALPLGLKADLEANPALAPYANYKLAQRILTEHELKDEGIRSRELSYLGRISKYRLNFEAHLFEHRLNDLIGLYPYNYPTVMGGLNGEVRGFNNLDSAVIRGQSVALRWRPWPGGLIYLAGSSTNISAEGPDAPAIASSGPQHTVTVLASQELPGNWRVSTAYYRVGAMAVLSSGEALAPTERIDVGLAKRFKLGTAPAEIALAVQNANGGIPVFKQTDIDRRTAWLTMRIAY